MQVRGAWNWLRKEAAKVADKVKAAEMEAATRTTAEREASLGDKAMTVVRRWSEGGNARRAVGVLVDAGISFGRLHKEQAALSTLAVFLRPGTSEEMQATVLRLLARSALAATSSLKRNIANKAENGMVGRASPAETTHRELQILLGVRHNAVASALDIARRSQDAELQSVALALTAELMRENEEVQAEAVHFDVVATITHKMDDNDNPIGQVAAAECAATISTAQGLKLLTDSHTMETLCRMLRSHAEPVKIAAINALAEFSAHSELQEVLERLFVFDSLQRLVHEPSPRLVAATLRALVCCFKSESKKGEQEHVARLRRHVSSAVQQGLVEGIVDLGLHAVQDRELSLACAGFFTMCLTLLVPDLKSSVAAPIVAEKKKEDVLDRKSRRGIAGLGAPSVIKPTSSQPMSSKNTDVLTTTRPFIAELLGCKTQFSEWIACMLSSSISDLERAAIELVKLTIDEKKEFLSVFTAPSVCWALTSVCARENRDDSLRAQALKTLMFLVRLNPGIGSHLHNGIVQSLIQRFKLNYTKSQTWQEHIANANTASMESDIENAIEIIVDKELDVLLRSEVLRWVRSMIRAEENARRKLAASGLYVRAVMTILKGDIGFPSAFKTHSLQVLAETLYTGSARKRWRMLNPITFAFREEYRSGISFEVFMYFCQFLMRLLQEERRAKVAEQEALDSQAQAEQAAAQASRAKALMKGKGIAAKVKSPEGGGTLEEKTPAKKNVAIDQMTQELVEALGYVLISVMHGNISMKVTAARLGLGERALALLAYGNSLSSRQLGADLLSSICSGAPSLSHQLLCLGMKQEFIANEKIMGNISTGHRPDVTLGTQRDDKQQRIHDASRAGSDSILSPVLRAIFEVIEQILPAARQHLDTSNLNTDEKITNELGKAKEEQNLQDFKQFAAKVHLEDLKRRDDIVPLFVSCVHALFALCGADQDGQAAGGLEYRWRLLRSDVAFVQARIRALCWSQRSIFDALVRLVLHYNPCVVSSSFQLLSVMCEGEEEPILAGKLSGDQDYLHIPADQLITDAGLILTTIKQLDDNEATALHGDDTIPSGGSCVVTCVHGAALNALTGLFLKVPYAAHLDKVAGRMGKILVDAVRSKEEQSQKHLLACFRTLARCHPAVRAPFYKYHGLEAVCSILGLVDGKQNEFAARSIQALASADALPNYGPEIEVNLTPYFRGESIATAAIVLLQLIQKTNLSASNVPAYIGALGALGRHRAVAQVILSENGLMVLVRLLSSTEACIISAAIFALSDLCADPFAFDVREKIRMLGALPCIVSLMSSPDHSVLESICVFLATAGFDMKLRPIFGKLDAVGQLLRVMEISCCQVVQTAAMHALGVLVQSTTSAKRFYQLGGCEILHECLVSNDDAIVSAAAHTIGAISGRLDSDVASYFADIRKAWVADSSYDRLLEIIEKQGYRSQEVLIESMQALEAFCTTHTTLETEYISKAIKIIQTSAMPLDSVTSSRRIRLSAIGVCARLTRYAKTFDQDVRIWLVTEIKKCLSRSSILEKTSACKAMAGVWWDNMCKDQLCKSPEDLDVVYEMLRYERGRPAAASALEGLIASDDFYANEIVRRGCTKHVYQLLLSSVSSEAAQAAQTMEAISKRPAGVSSLIAEIPGLKKEGIKPIIEAMDRHESWELKVACAACIAQVVEVPEWTIKVSTDASPRLIRMLQNTQEKAVVEAARTLTVMAKFPSTHRVLRQQGAIITLNALLTDSSERVRTAGCAALEQLSIDLECNDLMLRIGTAKTLLDMMKKDVFSMVCRAGETLQAMLKLPNAQADFIFLGGMEVLDALLDSQEVQTRKIPGMLLVGVLLNPRNKKDFKNSRLFEKCLLILETDPDMDVRRTLCEALRTFAGNNASVNIEYKTILHEKGFLKSLRALLQDQRTDKLGFKTRTSASKSICTMCSIVAVQNDIHTLGFMDMLVPLLIGPSAQQVVAAASAISCAIRYHVPNRKAALNAGLVALLAKSLHWEPDHGKIEGAIGNGKTLKKDNIRVRSAAADTLSALLECPHCRRTYQGTRTLETTIQGKILQIPSIVKIYDCPHREVCSLCAQAAADCNILAVVLKMLNAPDAPLRNSAAHLLCALSIGAPFHGYCEFSERVCEEVLEHDALPALLKMMRAKDAFDSGRAASEQFAAARAIDSLATRDKIRYECCQSGFIKALVEMLFSTLGRVKGSAALALARICASDSLCFYYNPQTEKTFWDIPNDLTHVEKPDGSKDEFAVEDVAYDTARRGYWIRGVFRPFEKVPYCDMLVNTDQVKHGPTAGKHKMKADASVFTAVPVLDLILDIFKSPIYDSEVNGWAAESCAIVSEFHSNRRHIASSGCVPEIVGLLTSKNDIWKEQAAIGLISLMYNEEARELAGSIGVVGSLTEILLSPYSSKSLKENAALAVAKACWNGANQVLALQSGAMMPVISMLTSSDIRQWCCAVEALMVMSNNQPGRVALAGAIPRLVNMITLDGVEGETPAQVRILATLANILSVEANLDIAVDCGVLQRYIDLTRSEDLLLLSYLTIAMSTAVRSERHKKRFFESGLVQVLLALMRRYAHNSECGEQLGAGFVRMQVANMMRMIADSDQFKRPIVTLGAFPALKVLAYSPENETLASCSAAIANLAFTDDLKDQARLDDLIPAVAHMMRRRSLDVQLEAARAVRVLSCNHKNKLLLVEAGALHGLRDMLDHKSDEARVRAMDAMSKLANNHVNGAALSRAGAVRPVVNLLDEANYDVLAGAARVLAEVTTSKMLDTRSEVREWGAIPKLGEALRRTTIREDERITLNVTRTINNMTTNEMLNSKAAQEARSFMLMEQRIGQVRQDRVAGQNREEMVRDGVGILTKVKAVVEGCTDPATRVHAQSALANIQGDMDL